MIAVSSAPATGAIDADSGGYVSIAPPGGSNGPSAVHKSR
jgi:hypothetical protein